MSSTTDPFTVHIPSIHPPSLTAGWASLDQYYRVVPGELTVITGVPNSGKSEWLDALLVNLSDHHGWSFAMCSMEKRVRDRGFLSRLGLCARTFLPLAIALDMQNTREIVLDSFCKVSQHMRIDRYTEQPTSSSLLRQNSQSHWPIKTRIIESPPPSIKCIQVPDHARQLLEKYTGRPFFNNTGYARNFERMSEAELHAGLEWIDDRFQVIRSDDDALPTIDWILEKARLAVYRNGVRGLVIDPYNELDHSRNRDLTETEYVSQLLSKLKRFAQHHDAHVWFVAHPRQLRDWKGGVRPHEESSRRIRALGVCLHCACTERRKLSAVCGAFV